ACIVSDSTSLPPIYLINSASPYVPSLDPPHILRNPMKMRPISGWVRMTILFTIAGFFEVAAYGQVSAFTPLYLPHLGIEAAAVAFWVGAITSFSNFVGLPFLPFWGALADRYGRKPRIIRSFAPDFV